MGVCKHCKYYSSFFKSANDVALCKFSKSMDPVGIYWYDVCAVKNKNYQCTDFIPKLRYRKRYKRKGI